MELELGLLLELELSVLLGPVVDELLLPPVLLLGVELVLGLELEPLGLGLGVELPPMLPLGLVWAMEILATPRNAAATAAQSTLVFISAPKGDW